MLSLLFFDRWFGLNRGLNVIWQLYYHCPFCFGYYVVNKGSFLVCHACQSRVPVVLDYSGFT